MENNDIYEYNIFTLFNYGIGKDIIRKLVDQHISPAQIYLNKLSSLNEIDIANGKKGKIVKAIEEMIEKKDCERPIYELLISGISKSTCDNLLLKGLTISTIRTSSPSELKNEYGIGLSLSDKLKKAISANDLIIEESSKNINTLSILEEFLKESTKGGPISLFQIQNSLKSVPEYRIENFNTDYIKLQNRGLIKNSLFGIEYNFLSIIDYIKNNFKNTISEIIIERLEGNTLESIAQARGLTRERVRQICTKLDFTVIGDRFKEDVYKNKFETYNWTLNEFIYIFDETATTYNYLDLRYKKGDKDISLILDDDTFTKEQKNKVKKKRKLAVTDDGSIIASTTEYLKKFMLTYAQEEIHLEKLLEIYNQQISNYPELHLEEFNSKNFEARLQRCDFAFFGSNHKVRYFDFNEFDENDLQRLKNLIQLPDGFYTTRHLFYNNLELMTELDIRNENELHNILKTKIDDEENNVDFIRMPNFLVGYKDRDIFLMEKIREYSPITLNDFVDILYEDYGHKKNTMLSYLVVNFKKYLTNGMFYIEQQDLKNETLENLKKLFKNDIYTLKQVKHILEENDYDDFSEIITSRNMAILGYRLWTGYILKIKYSSLYNYYETLIDTQDIIEVDDDFYKITAVYRAITYFSENSKLMKISSNKYITKRKMDDLGLTQEYLMNFISDIKDLYGNKD